MTNEKIFKETGSVYFDPVFEGMRNRRKKPQKKPDPRFNDVEKSINRAVSAQEAQGLTIIEKQYNLLK